MAAVLQQVLEKGELTKLPKAVQGKLERFLADQQSEIEQMKCRHEKFRVDCDQQYFEIEKRLAQSQERLVSESQDCQSLREQLNKKCEEQNELNEKVKDLETSNVRLVALQSQLTRAKDAVEAEKRTRAKDAVEAEKRELVRTNERRTQELEHINDDIKRLNEKLKDASAAKVDLQLKLDELQSSEVSIRYREKRLEQEKELLQTQNDWLNNELRSKTDELLSVQRLKGNEILELKGSLETKKDEVTRLDEQVKSLKASNENLQKQAEDLMNKLKEAKEQQTSVEEKFHNELKANIKLCNLYKSAAEDSEAKNVDMTRAVEELHKLLRESGDNYSTLQDQLAEMEAAKCQIEKDLGERIGKLEKELENANDLLSSTKRKGVLLSEEELTAMSPTAAAVAKVVKPGMKLTELYNAYVETQDQLLIEKQENKRITKYLDDIVKEVEAKAPILKRQREEYERMQKTVSSLSSKLEQAMKEMQRFQNETDKANKLSTVLENENQRLELQVKDLSQQVRVLLIELEEARGNHVHRDDDVSSANISSSSEVITQHLVTFRNVDELQEQNQKLLVALRELGDAKEKEEQEASAAQLFDLKRELDQALSELEQLRENRQHQMHIVESVARQRDMYRILLAQTTGVTLPAADEASITSTPRKSPGASQLTSTPAPAVLISDSSEAMEAKAALKQLKEVFENYRKEKAENDRMLNEQNEKLQDQVTELRSQNAKISTQLEFASKRYEMLQDNVEGYRREITSLQEKSQKLSATTQKQEQIINTMTQDLRAVNEKLAIAEVRAENLKREKELLKVTENRLTQERDSLLVEQRGQNLLLTNLQTIQVNYFIAFLTFLPLSDAEIRHRYTNQIEKLELELTQVKKKLEHEVEQKHIIGKNQDIHDLDLTRHSMNPREPSNSTTKDFLKIQIKKSYVDNKTLGNFEATLASRSSQLTLAKTIDEKENEMKALQEQMTQLQSELSKVQRDLQDKTSQEEQMRQLMNEKEEKTKKTLLGAKQKLAQLTSMKEQLSSENEDLKQRFSALEQQKEELEVRMSALKSQYDGRICRLERELREQQERHHEQRDETQEPSKGPEQRQITVKPTAAPGERGMASMTEPPTANIKPTPVVATPSKVTTAQRPPRASIRPMVTPAVSTPTATVMPTTQVETQEGMYNIQEAILTINLLHSMQSDGLLEHVPVFGSTSGSVRSTSPNVQLTPSQAVPAVQQQTAFVQPTQQSHAAIEPCTPEPAVEVVQSSPIERPSTSSVFSTFSATPSSSMSKRQREEGEESTMETSEPTMEEPDLPLNKKLRTMQRVEPEEDVLAEDLPEAESHSFDQESQETLAQSASLEYPQIHDGEESLPPIMDNAMTASDHTQPVQSSQDTSTKRDDIIVIESDEEDEEEDENNGEQEDIQGYEEDDEEEDDDDDDGGMGEEGNESNGEDGSADGNDAYEEEDTAGAEGTDPGTETEESMSTGDIGQRPADSQTSGDASSATAESSEAREQPSASDRPGPRPPQSPRRPPHPLPPRLTIHAPPQELGPPAQRIQMARRQSVGRGLQLTPGLGGMQHFFDDEDRTVPSTPTLVVPHRTDGFAEAIHSPQVAGVPRFRFGPPEDMPQASSSHSDLGQLASQGGLGMYETPLFLAHEEESGGRSVPTTPLQVAAPVSVFAENPGADTSDHASQSVPMVTTSTGNVSTAAEVGTADEDEVFVEAESEGIASDSILEVETRQDQDPVQLSETDLPSTSQDPPSSSSADTSTNQSKPLRRVRLHAHPGRPAVRGRQFTRQRGVPLGSRGGINRSNF
ncbi:hypothetical protein GDO81_017966 [Engystomops pustulosus]|uniref:Nucleoprotein TPR n=1 Tax=Engystomops pustulosus TaxID=76066 RepID=A0AAV7A8H2_ENGPU|nr:hypothetical protein GDO81_017966 [Engystomops pustulosus]